MEVFMNKELFTAVKRLLNNRYNVTIRPLKYGSYYLKIVSINRAEGHFIVTEGHDAATKRANHLLLGRG